MTKSVISIRVKLLVAVFSFVIITFLGLIWLSNITDFFQSFSVTIINKSDYDIVSVETGTNGTSQDTHTQKIKSGTTTKIKPKLSLKGEGTIYLKYTNSRGDIKEKTVCGYTETLSGNSKVTISNDTVTVEENCS